MLGVIAAVAAIAVTAAEPSPAPSEKRYTNTTAIVDVVAGEDHVNGEARWTSVSFGNLSGACWLTGADRAKALGNESGNGSPRRLSGLLGSFGVGSQHQRPHVELPRQSTLREPDDSGRIKIVDSLVLPPDAMAKVATAFTREANRPTGHVTQCELASEKEIPRPYPASCRPKMHENGVSRLLLSRQLEGQGGRGGGAHQRSSG